MESYVKANDVLNRCEVESYMKDLKDLIAAASGVLVEEGIKSASGFGTVDTKLLDLGQKAIVVSSKTLSLLEREMNTMIKINDKLDRLEVIDDKCKYIEKNMATKEDLKGLTKVEKRKEEES